MSTHMSTLLVRTADKELYTDAVILKMAGYDLVMWMNFLNKYDESIKCRQRWVVFNQQDEKYFVFMEEMRKKNKIFLSSLEAMRLLAQWCIGFLVNIMDKREN